MLWTLGTQCELFVCFKHYFFYRQIIKHVNFQLPEILTGFRENHKTSKLKLIL